MIYLFGNTELDFVKIGCSLDEYTFTYRKSAVLNSLPFYIDFIKIFDGDMQVEKKLHRYFINEKIKNEWFVLSKIIDRIEDAYASCSHIIGVSNEVNDTIFRIKYGMPNPKSVFNASKHPIIVANNTYHHINDCVLVSSIDVPFDFYITKKDFYGHNEHW